MKQNVIQEKSFDFVLSIISLYSILIKQNEYVISKQLLRSGTSISANIEEAIAGQSKRDFLTKMSIATKEARETKYWLRLLDKSQIVNQDYRKHLKDIEEVLNILTAIVKTTQQQIQNL